MFEKNLNIGYLIDFYGELLTERKKNALECYYNDDMSLSEISDVMNISRQGVRDIIKKAEDDLLFYESKLGLAKKFGLAQEHAKKALELFRQESVGDDIIREIKFLLENIG